MLQDTKGSNKSHTTEDQRCDKHAQIPKKCNMQKNGNLPVQFRRQASLKSIHSITVLTSYLQRKHSERTEF